MLPIRNPESLTSLYDEPSFAGVSLHEVTLQRDGPTVSLRFDLATFPDHPPARWHPAFNTAQVILDIFGASDLRISGFTTTPVGDLLLDQQISSLIFNFSTEGCAVSGKAEGAMVQRITGYENADQ